jgi:hypothetical protein
MFPLRTERIRNFGAGINIDTYEPIKNVILNVKKEEEKAVR